MKVLCATIRKQLILLIQVQAHLEIIPSLWTTLDSIAHLLLAPRVAARQRAVSGTGC